MPRYDILFIYGILFAAFIAIGFLVPDNPDDFGILTTIPAIFMIIFIFRTKRIVEGLKSKNLNSHLMRKEQNITLYQKVLILVIFLCSICASYHDTDCFGCYP